MDRTRRDVRDSIEPPRLCGPPRAHPWAFSELLSVRPAAAVETRRVGTV